MLNLKIPLNNTNNFFKFYFKFNKLYNKKIIKNKIIFFIL